MDDMDDLDNPMGRGSGGGGGEGGGGRRPRPRNVNSGGWGFGDGGGGFESGSTAAAGGAAGEQTGPRGFAEDTGSPPRDDPPINKKHMNDDDDGVIPVIPDLEEEAEEDITRQVAAPPVAYNSNLRNVRELDAAQATQSRGLSALQTNPEEGIDLAVLTQKLCGEHQVFEEDVTWDHELIFQEVASEINADLDTGDGGEGGGAEINGTDRP